MRRSVGAAWKLYPANSSFSRNFMVSCRNESMASTCWRVTHLWSVLQAFKNCKLHQLSCVVGNPDVRVSRHLMQTWRAIEVMEGHFAHEVFCKAQPQQSGCWVLAKSSSIQLSSGSCWSQRPVNTIETLCTFGYGQSSETTIVFSVPPQLVFVEKRFVADPLVQALLWRPGVVWKHKLCRLLLLHSLPLPIESRNVPQLVVWAELTFQLTTGKIKRMLDQFPQGWACVWVHFLGSWVASGSVRFSTARRLIPYPCQRKWISWMIIGHQLLHLHLTSWLWCLLATFSSKWPNLFRWDFGLAIEHAELACELCWWVFNSRTCFWNLIPCLDTAAFWEVRPYVLHLECVKSLESQVSFST